MSDALEAVLAFCREGPSGAHVQRVEIADCEAVGLEGIEIRR